ncbi:MAG: histidine phosphatase family protein [Ignavibacteria bacterium]
MKLFLIRHAEAIEHETDAVKDDEHRYITAFGRTITRKIAKTLREELKDLEIIFSSPLIRAVQTAEIISTRIKFKSDILLVDELTNESTTASLLQLLSKNSDMKSVALVGHEPKMGILLTSLSGKRDINDFRKSSVCLIDFDASEGRGKFEWYFDSKSMEFVK